MALTAQTCEIMQAAIAICAIFGTFGAAMVVVMFRKIFKHVG